MLLESTMNAGFGNCVFTALNDQQNRHLLCPFASDDTLYGYQKSMANQSENDSVLLDTRLRTDNTKTMLPWPIGCAAER